MIERFEREYVQYHGLSEHRAVRQVRELRAFEKHAGRPIQECGAPEFKSYLTSLVESGLHVNTVAKKAGMIRPYFGWAFDVGLVSGDTLMAVKRVKDPKGATKKTRPKPYSAKELRQFWADLDRAWPLAEEKFIARWQRGTSRWHRVYTHAMRLQLETIVRLALDCGLRKQEIWGLTIDDMHPDNFYVVVTNGKREAGGLDKAREVPFTKQSRLAVARWLEFRALINPKHAEPWLSLYGAHRAKPLRWARYEELIGTVGPYTLHRFRHTCATNWLRAGVDLSLVSRLLGHSTIQQTLCYAEIVKDDIHKAMHTHEDAFERLVGSDAR